MPTNFTQTGGSTASSPTGMTASYTKTSHPLFGGQVPLISSKVTSPAGLVRTENNTFTFSAINPSDAMTYSFSDIKSVNGAQFKSVYDRATRKYSSQSPLGRTSYAIHDTTGRVTRTQTGTINAANYAYDNLGRLTGVTQGIRTASFAYDNNDNLTTAIDSLGRTTAYAYDANGRVLTKTLTDGRAVSFTYDSNDNMTSLKTPSNSLHTFTYTPIDMASTYSAPAAASSGVAITNYAYDLDRRLTTITRPDASTISFTYDAKGRPATVTTNSGAINFTFNNTTGNLTSIAGPYGLTTSYTYDGTLPKSEQWTGPVNGTVNYGYDNYFRVTSESVNGQNPISFTYDADGLLTGTGALTMTRHAQNGYVTAKALASTATAYAYDAYGSMTSRTDSFSGSQFLRQDFTQDNSGRIIGKTETSGATTKAYAYLYDQAGRLTDVATDGVNSAHYGYDANGNRTSYTATGANVSATYDAQDRLLTYGNNSYAYTANGELKTKTNSAGTTNYTYDAFGSLVKVVLPDNTVLEYITDSSGRRIAKKLNGAITKAWLYEGSLRPIAELDSAGAIVARYVYGTGVNVPEYMIKAGVTYRIVTDQLGSVRMVVNASTGAVAQEMKYDEFGVVTQDTNLGFTPFGFGGGLYDADTHLTRFGARDYDAETGRWTAKDPIGFNGGDTNLYGYVLQDPVNGVDVWGLQDKFIAGDNYRSTDKIWPLDARVCDFINVDASVEVIRNFVAKHGRLDISFNYVLGIGLTGQISITRSGISGYVGGGVGLSMGVVATTGAKVGNTSGLTGDFTLFGGVGPGVFSDLTISQGGTSVYTGAGAGLGLGTSLTLGYTGDILQ